LTADVVNPNFDLHKCQLEMDTALKAELPMFVSLGDRSVPFFSEKGLGKKSCQMSSSHSFK